MKRVGLSPVILLNQPPPTSIEFKDLAWSWPKPVRSAGWASAAKAASRQHRQSGKPHTNLALLHVAHATNAVAFDVIFAACHTESHSHSTTRQDQDAQDDSRQGPAQPAHMVCCGIRFNGSTAITSIAQLTRIKDVVDGPLLVVVLAGALHSVPLVGPQGVPKEVGDGLAVAHNKQQLAVFHDATAAAQAAGCPHRIRAELDREASGLRVLSCSCCAGMQECLRSSLPSIQSQLVTTVQVAGCGPQGFAVDPCMIRHQGYIKSYNSSTLIPASACCSPSFSSSIARMSSQGLTAPKLKCCPGPGSCLEARSCRGLMLVGDAKHGNHTGYHWASSAE